MVEDLGVRPGLTLGHPPGAVRRVDATDPAVLMVLKVEAVDQGYLGLKVMRQLSVLEENVWENKEGKQ